MSFCRKVIRFKNDREIQLIVICFDSDTLDESSIQKQLLEIQKKISDLRKLLVVIPVQEIEHWFLYLQKLSSGENLKPNSLEPIEKIKKEVWGSDNYKTLLHKGKAEEIAQKLNVDFVKKLSQYSKSFQKLEANLFHTNG